MNRAPLRDQSWGGGALFVNAICDYANDFGWEVVHKLEDGIDAILMVDPRHDELRLSYHELVRYKEKCAYKVPIIHRVNECDKRKGTDYIDQMLHDCSKYTDATVFVSSWMKEYHTSKKSWCCTDETNFSGGVLEGVLKKEVATKNFVVYNGVNHDHFRPSQKKLDNSKVNIVYHHWSDNRLKGADVYEALDEWIGSQDRFTATYIGRHKCNFKNTKIIPPMHGKMLGAELAKYDIYVSGSRFDPGPNHVIEALACGLETFVHSDGGGAVEFAQLASIGHVYSNADELIKILDKWTKSENTIGKHISVQASGWNTNWYDCAAEYFAIIDYCTKQH